MYSTLPYYLSKILVEMPINVTAQLVTLSGRHRAGLPAHRLLDDRAGTNAGPILHPLPHPCDSYRDRLLPGDVSWRGGAYF